MDTPLQSYSERSDDALARLCAQGDEDAAVALIVRYLPLVRARAGVFASGSGESYEDLCQEGTVGLLAAVRDYDASKASFATFARLCIDRVLISAERSRKRKKQIPDANLIPLDGEEGLPSAPQDDPEAIVIQREDYARLVRKVAKTLSPLENRVLSLYLDGVSYSEIAERLNLSAKAVDNALQRIRRKLK